MNTHNMISPSAAIAPLLTVTVAVSIINIIAPTYSFSTREGQSHPNMRKAHLPMIVSLSAPNRWYIDTFVCGQSGNMFERN